MSIAAGEYGSSTGGVNYMVNIANQGFVGSGSTINCPTITTGTTNERVICAMIDDDTNGGTYTAGTGFTVDSQGTNFRWLKESQAKVGAGSVTAGATYSNSGTFVSGIIAIKP
jgi:hypothetical protein